MLVIVSPMPASVFLAATGLDTRDAFSARVRINFCAATKEIPVSLAAVRCARPRLRQRSRERRRCNARRADYCIAAIAVLDASGEAQEFFADGAGGVG
ncbi:hypothetical protein [Dokdonella ginsengisoli]|uniref:Uncharacterized protein n=1 Tax=Dokdonella ginsengisoli TaxID=363846 RepID=A0ABV9QRF9_9GAMM